MKKQVRYWFAALCGLVLSFSAPAQPKLIGYLPLYNFQRPDITAIPYSGLTHLNLAFIRTDSSGKFSAPAWIDSVIMLAHAAKVKVLASIGGGNAPAYYTQLLSDEHRTHFVDELVGFIEFHQLDGIDVDLEGKLIDEHYTALLDELSQRLHPQKKILSAAVATWLSPRISDEALTKLDLVNIMSYDKTGPWTPGQAGPHSPYEMAEQDLHHWGAERKVAKKKLILGVPFYGYWFAKDSVRSMTYAAILANFPGASLQDSVVTTDNTIIYYNGAATIRRKTLLALQKAGGIMVWQLLQDADNDASLLKLIKGTMDKQR